MLASASV